MMSWWERISSLNIVANPATIIAEFATNWVDNMPNTGSFLFSESRRKVLGLLLLHPDARYHVREIARLTNTSAGSLHRELAMLAKVGVLIRQVSGHQVYYQANLKFPIFSELASILRKTSGLVDVLAEALVPVANKIEIALIFGSAAKGTENMGSDVDVLIIGKISFKEVVSALYESQAMIGREINPKVYTRDEWQKLIEDKNGFIQEVIKNPKLFILGEKNELNKFDRDQL